MSCKSLELTTLGHAEVICCLAKYVLLSPAGLDDLHLGRYISVEPYLDTTHRIQPEARWMNAAR